MEDDVGNMGPDRSLLEDCDTPLAESASSSYKYSCHRVDDNETVDQTMRRLVTSFEKFEAAHLKPSPAPNMQTAASPAAEPQTPKAAGEDAGRSDTIRGEAAEPQTPKAAGEDGRSNTIRREAAEPQTPKAAGEDGRSNTFRGEAAEPQTPWSFPNNMQQCSGPVLMAIPISYCLPESPISSANKAKIPRRNRKKDKVDLQNDPAAAINIAAGSTGSAGSTSTTAKNKKAETPRKRKNKQGVADADLVNGQVEVAAAGGSASTVKADKKGKGRPGRKRIYSIEALMDSTLEADNKGKTEVDGDQPGNSSSAAKDFVKKNFYRIENPDWLPQDWYIMGRPRENGKQVDTYYYQPGGSVFKSAVEVKRLLGLSNTKVTRINRKPRATATAAADGAGS